MNTRWTRAVTALALGGGLALAAPALPAVGAHSPPTFAPVIEVGDEVTTVAKGAGVVVPVEVTCEPGTNAFVSVQVTQARGRHASNGYGFTEVACEGHTEVEVFVSAQGGGAFKNGAAVVQASLFSCGSFGCEEQVDVEEVRISRSRP